ncbi:MAG: hypothetical protein LBM02_06935 [Lachnospiraceae bacterium]|jgi:hypothetical protein|nr:hypothetical protein [Lachnospiraceae bacterium]
MSDKVFKRVLYGVLILGILGTAILSAYTIYLFKHLSLLTFIASEGVK